MQMDEPATEPTDSSLYFGLSTAFFLLLAVFPTLTAVSVLGYLFESGFSANISYLMFAVFCMTPLLVLELIAFFVMIGSSHTRVQRMLLIPAACLLALDATLLFGFAMNASGC